MDNNHRLLTADEEIDLAMRIEAGQDAEQRVANGDTDPGLSELITDGVAARDTLFMHNLRLVYQVARNYHSADIAFSEDDLVQEGMIGLTLACHKFDWRSGNRFSTFAFWWIRQSIARARKQAGTIRMPTTDPTSASFVQAQTNARTLLDLDAPFQGPKGEQDRTLIDVLDSGYDTEEEALNRVLVDQAFRAPMNDTWRNIMHDWMYGLSYEEAGAKHGLSRSIGWLAIQRMREAVGE